MAKRKSTKKKAAPKKSAAGKSEEVPKNVEAAVAVAVSGDDIPVVDDEPTDEDLAATETPEDDHLDEASLQKMFEDATKTEAAALGLKMAEVDCPTCGEIFEVGVDPSEEGQEMIQDCQACCHPVSFSVEFVDGEAVVSSFRSD